MTAAAETTIPSVRGLVTQETFPTWRQAAYADLARRLDHVAKRVDEVHRKLDAVLAALNARRGREEDAPPGEAPSPPEVTP